MRIPRQEQHGKEYNILPLMKFIKYKNKLIPKLTTIAVCCILLYTGILYALQEKLLYYPDKFHTAPTNELSVFQEKIITAHDGTPITTWYFKGDSQKPAILFFHGNAGQIAKFARQLIPFTKRGYSVLMMEYRGFGATPGKISEKNFYADSITVFDWLKQQNSKIIIYGYSLGTTMAINVAYHRNADKLILTAPFSSMRNLVAEKPIPLAGLVLKDTYDSLSMIKKINIPLLIIHGKNDLLIPYSHAETLFTAAASINKEIKLVDYASHATIFFFNINIPFIFDWLERN